MVSCLSVGLSIKSMGKQNMCYTQECPGFLPALVIDDSKWLPQVE